MKYLFFILFLTFSLSSCIVKKPYNTAAIYENIGPYLYYYEGIQNRLYGNQEESIKNLQKSLQFNPNNSAVYYELALAYANLNDGYSALLNIEEAVRIEPNNPYYRNFLGMLYINNQRFDEALANQKELIRLDSLNSTYQYQLALIYTNLSNFDEALNLLNKLETSYGILPRVSEAKTKIYFELNNIEKAENEINILIEIQPDNPLYLLYKSDIFFRKGEDSLGFDIIQQAINLNPEFSLSRIELYQRQIEIGNVKQALTTLKELFKSDNVNINEKANLFYPLLFEQSNYVTHALTLDTIITIGRTKHPNSIQMNEIAFEHYLRRNSFNSARDVLQNLLNLDKDNPMRFEKLISFDFSLQQRELALNNSQKAIIKFPDNYIFYVYHALLDDELGDPNKAISILDEGIKNVTINEHLSELYGTKGDFYYKTKRLNEAFKAYDLSLKSNPNNARILNNYSYYLALEKVKLSKALEMSSKAVDLEPNNSTYIDTKGWVLFTMERYEEARDVLRNAIAKSGSTSAVINEHYGDALYKTGNSDNAYIYWLKAKELEGGSTKLDEKIRTKTYVP